MNLAAVSSPAPYIESGQPGARTNRFQPGFDLLLDVPKDREDIISPNIGRPVAGYFFSSPIESDDVATQVGGHEAASHAFDDAIVEKTVVGKIFCGAGKLRLAASYTLRKLAG